VAASEGGQGGAAVLCSGGLDSVVLLADVARRAGGARVVPIYVSVGLAWESEERAVLERLSRSPALHGIESPVALQFDMRDVYPPTHWAILGEAPGVDTPDEDVYLEGRNLVLLTKAAVFMARARLTQVFLGPLAGNPFPDATPEFFAAMERSLSVGLASPIEVRAPFLDLRKSDVIKLGRSIGVPLELTLSCMQPVNGVHCGRCSKCRERRDAFNEAGVEDLTRYGGAP
jgi:7-cyano-7-deazaguanine synthase